MRPMRHRTVVPILNILAASTLLFAATPRPAPILRILPRFTAPTVPALGPDEHPVDRSWPLPSQPTPSQPDPTAAPIKLPGRGLAQHPMLFAGEGYNNILLVDGGKVIWNYFTGPGGEIDDIWLLTNGNILFTRQFQVEEVTPEKKIVWHYDPPPGTEVHSCQPIGLDKVLIVQNGLPPKLMVLNIKSGKVEVEHALPEALLR